MGLCVVSTCFCSRALHLGGVTLCGPTRCHSDVHAVNKQEVVRSACRGAEFVLLAFLLASVWGVGPNPLRVCVAVRRAACWTCCSAHVRCYSGPRLFVTFRAGGVWAKNWPHEQSRCEMFGHVKYYAVRCFAPDVRAVNCMCQDMPKEMLQGTKSQV